MARPTYSDDDDSGQSTPLPQDPLALHLESRRRNHKRQMVGLVVAGVFVALVGITVAVTLTQIQQNKGSKTNNSSSNNNNNGQPSSRGTVIPTQAPAVPDGTFAPTATGFNQACNGLESLCDVRVNEVMFATLHNAVATNADGVPIFLANHEKSLEDALKAGWRGLNFDVGKCPQAHADQPVRLVHGTCALGTRDPIDVFDGIATFLQQRPRDVLLLPLQFDNALGGAVSLIELYNLMDNVTIRGNRADNNNRASASLTSQLYQHPGRGTPWPTLRELIQADTRLLLFHYNSDESCDLDASLSSNSNSNTTTCPPGFHGWFTYATETQYAFDSVAAIIDNTNSSCELTRGTRGTRDFFGINLFTTIPSTTNCEQLNDAAFLEQHLQDCSDYWSWQLADGSTQGRSATTRTASLVLTDCWNVGSVLDVVLESNRRLVAPTIRSAEVSLLVQGVTTNGDDTVALSTEDQAVFLSTCSAYFANQFNAMDSTSSSVLTNIYCRSITQSTVTSRRQRQRQRRALQDTVVWQVTVLLQADDRDGNGTLETGDLEAMVDSTSNAFVDSLTVRGGETFSSVSQITTASGNDGNGDNGNNSRNTAPTAATTTGNATELTLPTSSPTNATSSTEPSASPQSRAPSSMPTLEQTTLSPTISPTTSPTTNSPSTTAPSVAVVETLAPTKGSVDVVPPPDVDGSTLLLCNGHANLCDLPANAILYATVHNAASTQADGATILPNHAQNLSSALLAGYRGINVDIGKCDGQVGLVHGFCGLGFVDPIVAFGSIVDFLQDNPNEVIVMPTQINTETGGDVTLAEIDAVLANVTGFQALMYDHRSKGTANEPSWPTLRELIAANTRILFFFYNSAEQQCSPDSAANPTIAACPAGFHDWFDYAGESQFRFAEPVQLLDDKAYACEITRGLDGLLQFYGVNVFTELPSEESCAALNAQEALSNHLQACATLVERPVNLVLVDCWDIGGVLAVVSTHNAAL